MISSLSDLVVRAHPGTTQEPIHYPAAVDPVSVKEGIDSVADQLGDYVRKCPDSQVVLVGISQGIRVILDALCGSGYPDLGGTGKPRVRQSVGSHGMETTRTGPSSTDSPQSRQWWDMVTLGIPPTSHLFEGQPPRVG